MTSTDKKIEILSPVGNTEMLTAAVRSGADAVYLGFGDFNARRNAENFNKQAFTDAVRYCRARGVKVYLTLNTVLSDQELPLALDAARYAFQTGIDAVIVQDIGLARLLHDRLPELPLHASTQLTVHSVSALPVLKELGFVQVVASREMSRTQLKCFCDKAKELDISVEIFVHGALCMCMSGQCYLSAVLGGRSGNRGLCAGPCRLPFKAKGGTGYDLSLKDLSLVEYIDELRCLGVSSLKIEGRMKRPEYVAAATAVCRNAVNGKKDEQLKEDLQKVFSRSGFTDGYYTEKLGREMFGIRDKDDVMSTSSVIKSIHELYRRERQSVAITGHFTACTDRPVTLTVTDGINTVDTFSDAPHPAQGKAADREYVISQLSKTGSTPFYFTDLTADISDGLMIAASTLNALRREALDRLYDMRAHVNVTVPPQNEDNYITAAEKRKATASPHIIGRFSSLSQIPEDLTGLSCVVLPLEERFEDYSGTLPLLVDIPRGIVSEQYIADRLGDAFDSGIKYAFCGNIAAVELAKAAGLLPIFDFSMNIFNTQSIISAKALGAAAAVASFELKCDQINRLGDELPIGIIGYGHLPLMLTRNCPLKNGTDCRSCRKNGYVTDRKGIKFPVRCRSGFSEVLNPVPLYIADRTDGFAADFVTLYFTIEDKTEVQSVISRYTKQLPFDGEFTRGLYFRGVE